MKEFELKDFVIDGKRVRFQRDRKSKLLSYYWMDDGKVWYCGYYFEMPDQERAEYLVEHIPAVLELFKVVDPSEMPRETETWTSRYLEPEYKYGMRLRGFSHGCQPMKGLLKAEDSTDSRYYSILRYNRKLTEEELRDYELDLIETLGG